MNANKLLENEDAITIMLYLAKYGKGDALAISEKLKIPYGVKLLLPELAKRGWIEIDSASISEYGLFVVKKMKEMA